MASLRVAMPYSTKLHKKFGNSIGDYLRRFVIDGEGQSGRYVVKREGKRVDSSSR